MWRLGLMFSAGCSLLPVSATSATAAPSSSTTSLPPGTRTAAPIDGQEDRPPVYLPLSKTPADPWAGVRGGKPVTFQDGKDHTDVRWAARDEKVACTALHDHCLPMIAWMWVRAIDVDAAIKTAHVVAFATYGATQPVMRRHRGGFGTEDKFTAYRTVPATRKNLVPGTLAVAHDQPIPEDSISALDMWTMGVVERVDWDLGFVWFAGSEDARFITATRIAVLSYAAPDGKVTILGGKQRDELAVKPADVIVPE